MAAAALCPLGPTSAPEATERQACWTSFLWQAVDACAGAIRDAHLLKHVESATPACLAGEASRRLPQSWQTRLLMHRRTLTKNRLRTLRMACCGSSRINAPSAMGAALLSVTGFEVSLYAILTGVSRSVYPLREAPCARALPGHTQTPRKWLRSVYTHVRPAVLGPAPT